MTENSVTQLYQKLDFFRISHSFGLGKSFVFYLFGCIGTISFLVSINILAFNNQNTNYNKIDQIINIINDWNTNTKYKVQNNQYRATLEQLNNPNSSSQFEFKLIKTQSSQNPLARAFGIIEQNDQDQIIIPSSFHQASINPKKRLIKKLSVLEGDEFRIALETKKSDSTQWLLIHKKSQTDHEITIKKQLHQKLSTADMMLQGVCQNVDDCQEQCKSNRGTLDNGFCSAEYFTQEVCFVVEQTQNDVKIVDGCFGGQFEKLSLTKPNQMNFTIRNKGDPYLTAIKLSGNGSCPYLIDQQPHIAIARQLFIMGSFCFFICGFLVQQFQLYWESFIFNFQKIRQTEMIELQERQTTTQESKQIQKTIRILPLNY